MKQTFSEFRTKHGITIESRLYQYPNPNGVDWKEKSFHWKATLIRNTNALTVDFYQGPGHCELGVPTPPELENVLECLRSDSSALGESFEVWCGNFDYDTDSRKALATFRQCQENGEDLKSFMGRDWEEFLGCEE